MHNQSVLGCLWSLDALRYGYVRSHTRQELSLICMLDSHLVAHNDKSD